MSDCEAAGNGPRSSSTPPPYRFRGGEYQSASDALDVYVADWEARHGRISASRSRHVGAGDPMLTRIVSVLWEVIQARTRPADKALRCLRKSNEAMLKVAGSIGTTAPRCEHYLGRGSGDDGFSMNSMSTETLLSLDPFVFCVNCVNAWSDVGGGGDALLS